MADDIVQAFRANAGKAGFYSDDGRPISHARGPLDSEQLTTTDTNAAWWSPKQHPKVHGQPGGFYSDPSQYEAVENLSEDVGYWSAWNQNRRAGGKTVASLHHKFASIFHSIAGNDAAMEESLYHAGKADRAAEDLRGVNAGELFQEYVRSEKTWDSFVTKLLPAMGGFTGEALPTMAPVLVEALAGTALAAGVTYFSGGSAVPATASAITAAGGAAVLKKGAVTYVVPRLAAKGVTERLIRDSVRKTLAKEKLNKTEERIMRLVYANYRSKVMRTSMGRGAKGGAFMGSYPMGGGTFFGQYANEGMTDPVSAWKSLGLAVPFAAVEVAADVAVFKAFRSAFPRAFGGTGMIEGSKRASSSFLGNVGRASVVGGAAETLAEGSQSALESAQRLGWFDQERLPGDDPTTRNVFENQLDDTYTAEQARLDIGTGAFAGFSAGLTIGGIGGSAGATVTAANTYLQDWQIKRAVRKMDVEKFSELNPHGVQVEPKQWLKDQIKTMMNPGNDKDSVWIEANSLEQWSEIEEEIAAKYGKEAWFASKLRGNSGGLFLTTNQEKATQFNNIFTYNNPSTELLEGTLSGFLGYGRARDVKDDWVVEVREKATGSLVHYHQTSRANKEGEAHLNKAKELFKNNTQEYTFKLVDAKTHLEERQKLATPLKIDEMSMDLNDDNIFEQEPFPISDPENNTRGSLENPYRNRTGKPWAHPDEQYEEQFPDVELIEEARLATHPLFRASFDELIAQDKLSKYVLNRYLELMGTDATNDTTIKIEETEENTGIELVKYNVSGTQTDIDIEAETAQILRKGAKRGKANKLKNKKASPWTVGGKPIDMPFAVTQMRNLLRRMGENNNLFYGDLSDAFSVLYGEIADTLEYNGSPVTAKELETATVYSQGGKNYTLKELVELAAEERDEGRSFGTDPREKEERLETEMQEMKQKIMELQDSGKEKVWWQYKEWTEQELDTELQIKEGQLEEIREGQTETNVEPTQEEKWDDEYEKWVKQPLSKKVIPIKNRPTINGKKVNKKTKLEVSNKIHEHFGESSKFIENITKAAAKILNISKPILVFSTSEEVDLGDARLNKLVAEAQGRVQTQEKLKGLNMEFRDYDVILLNTSPGMKLEAAGFYIHALGHEIGHSFLRMLQKDSLLNKKLRSSLLKEHEKDVAANPGIKQWQGEKGFDEWFSDKTSALLFDLQKGKVFKANNLAQSFLKRVTEQLKAFWEYLTKTGKDNVATRFAYNESFAEFVKGLQTSQKEAQVEKDVREPGYEELAHIEELLEAAGFKDRVGFKTLDKIEKEVERMITTGKIPKWLRNIFNTAHGVLTRMGPTGKEIANFFHKVSGVEGTEGLINAVSGQTYELLNELGEILGIDAVFTEEAQEVLKEASDETIATEDLKNEKAKAVRKWLDEIYDRLELAKYGIKKRENFFPRLLNVQEIAANEDLRNALVDLIVRKAAFTKTKAQEMVDDIIASNEFDEYNLTEEEKKDSRFIVGSSKKRAEAFENISFNELFEEGLAVSPEIAVAEYLRKTIRNIEFRKRGGTKKLQELVDQLPENQRSVAEDAINAMLGKVAPIKNKHWKTFTNWALFYNVVSLLSMVVFASIPDAAGPVLRSRQMDLKSITNNLYHSLTADEAADLAKSIGVNGLGAMMDMNLYQGETSQAQYGYAKKWTNGWFKLTQLERWTRFTRNFAAGMGRDFLVKHAKIVTDPKRMPGSEEVLNSKRYLEELGITPGEINTWVKQGEDVSAFPNVRAALRRFVDESIVRPNSAERPIWASDPNFAIVWQLKSFYYAYGKNIIGGLIRETQKRAGNTKTDIADTVWPLLMMGLTIVPLAMIGWDLRERFKIGLAWLLPGISPEDANYRQSQSMSSGEYWFEVIDRGGMTGKYSLLFPLFMENRRYGDPFFVPMLGPTAEKTWNIATGDKSMPELIPVYSNLNTSNFGGRND